MLELDDNLRSDQAARAIPLCVNLIYKHREIEALMWEMIAFLSTKLYPKSVDSIVSVGGVTPFCSVKHGENLRTVFERKDRAALIAAVNDKTVVLPRVVATLIGDPGVNAEGYVHYIMGKHYVRHMQMRYVWRDLHARLVKRWDLLE